MMSIVVIILALVVIEIGIHQKTTGNLKYRMCHSRSGNGPGLYFVYQRGADHPDHPHYPFWRVSAGITQTAVRGP
jgi:hypothetical protein